MNAGTNGHNFRRAPKHHVWTTRIRYNQGRWNVVCSWCGKRQ